MRQTKEQKKKYHREYHFKNREILIKYQKEYRFKNKEILREKRKEYYLKNRKEVLERSKKYQQKNKEKILEYHIKYRLENREKIKEGNKKQYYKNLEKRRELSRKYRQKNLEKVKEKLRKYHWKNREKKLEYGKKYYYENKEKFLEKAREYIRKPETRERIRKRRLTDVNYRIKDNLRRRINGSMVKGYKSARTMELIGCTIEELWKYLEYKFEPWMTRENYGLWHVDHIIPCASFNLIDPEQQKECFHYTNLQPLEAIANIKKGVR